MKEIIRNTIENVVSHYWKPYNELECEISQHLIKKQIFCNSVFCTGELINLYVYVQVKNVLFVYNQNNDIFNAFLLKNYFNESDIIFDNGLATFEDFHDDLNSLPKVVLINMCVIENFPIPRLNLSTGSIAAYIRFYQKARVIILDMQLRITVENIISKLLCFSPDIIGISISFGQKNLSDKLIHLIKSNERLKNILLVVGNVIPALYCQEYLNQHSDILVSYAEGEDSFIDLIDYHLGKKNISEVRGIAYVTEKGHFKMNAIDFLDISNLPFPALDTLQDVIKYKGAITLELSRGCNYSRCSFCPRKHKGKVWRCLTVDRMVLYFSTLFDICKKLNQNPFFYIADEEFIGQLPHTQEVDRIKEFCKRIKELNIKVHFDISARVDSIYKEDYSSKQNIEKLQMWVMLKEIGLQRLFLGVESGCDRQLERFNKGTTSEQNALAIKLITALGINIRIGYISFDPLMPDFDDLIIGHSFVERRDILYNASNLNQISISRIYESIVNNISVPEVSLQNKPLYYKISYPLTSLEVLFSTSYSIKMKKYQEINHLNLLQNIDMNMARYNVGYVNYMIGNISNACQMWIDYNFPVLYSLKGLYKTSNGETRDRIYELMQLSKAIDHYLLNFILYQLSLLNNPTNLIEFAKKNNIKIILLDNENQDIIISSLNYWQEVEQCFIEKIISLLKIGIISDTDDVALKISIINWKKNRGHWRMIN